MLQNSAYGVCINVRHCPCRCFAQHMPQQDCTCNVWYASLRNKRACRTVPQAGQRLWVHSQSDSWPQVWGLYGAFAPCMVYAGFGSSRQLVRCPTRHECCANCCSTEAMSPDSMLL